MRGNGYEADAGEGLSLIHIDAADDLTRVDLGGRRIIKNITYIYFSYLLCYSKYKFRITR